MLYKKVNPWFSSALSVSTSNQQIPHRQREHRNTFSTEALNSPYEVAAGIFLVFRIVCFFILLVLLLCDYLQNIFFTLSDSIINSIYYNDWVIHFYK
jgi:hypothetical protein